jgi:hypothetical protein
MKGLFFESQNYDLDYTMMFFNTLIISYIILLIVNTVTKYEYNIFLFDLSLSFIFSFYFTFLKLYPVTKFNIFLFFIAIEVCIIFITYQLNKKNLIPLAYVSNCYILYFYPLIASIGIEYINIRSFHQLESISKTVYLHVAAVIIFFIYLFLSYKKINIHYFRKHSIFILFVSLLFFSEFPAYKIEVMSFDKYETANYSNSINEYFTFGKIPILETFDAHMLNHTIWGILYGYLTSDFKNAVFNPYLFLSYIFSSIILYLILKELIEEEIIFLILFLIPFYLPNQNMFSSYFFQSYSLNLAIIPLFSFIRLYKKPSNLSYFIFWSTIAVSFLYRLDIGISYSIGAITVLIIHLKKTNFINVKPLVTSLMIFISGTLLTIGIIGYFKGINITERSMELIDIISSNQFWGYPELGKNNNVILYYFSYIFIPIAVLLLIIFLMYEYFRKKDKKRELKLLICIALGVSYITNIQRSVVRHTLFEGNLTGILLFNIDIFLAASVAALANKNKSNLFIATFIISNLFIYSISYNGYGFNSANSLSRFFDKLNDKQYLVNDNRKNRIILNSSYKNLINNSEISKIILYPNTFINFTDNPFLYTLLNKRNPSYINQFPSLLNTDISTDIFLNNIEKDKFANFAITENYCNKNNDSNFSIVYFSISQYINSNFTPLYKINNYIIWVKDTYIDQVSFNKRLEKYKISPLDFTCSFQISDDLKYGPLLFLKKTDTSSFNRVLSEDLNVKNEVNYVEKTFKIKKDKKYYMKFESSQINESEIKFSLMQKSLKHENEIILSSYSLKTTSTNENNAYLIPISADYNWFNTEFKQIQIKTEPSSLKFLKLTILEK